MKGWVAGRRLFPVDGVEPPSWTGGFGALPFVVRLAGRPPRVFFSGRDPQQRSAIGACELDLGSLSVDPASVSDQPLVTPGPPGAFDDSGCTMSCVVPFRDALYLYYTGWTLGRTVPFHLAIGLAVSHDEGRSFVKVSPAPVMGRHRVDPFLCASPAVLAEDGRLRMWYVSAVRWEPDGRGSFKHFYLVKYAESDDGVEWRRDGRVCIDFRSTDEHAIGRPHVVRTGDLYRMWYCYRGASYRIGYAESPDGLRWTRHDERDGIAPAASGWDAQMQAYPVVVPSEPGWVMLYNGNGYGATGFGYATIDTLP